MRPSVVNVFQDRDKLYNNRNNLIEFRTLITKFQLKNSYYAVKISDLQLQKESLLGM